MDVLCEDDDGDDDDDDGRSWLISTVVLFVLVCDMAVIYFVVRGCWGKER